MMRLLSDPDFVVGLLIVLIMTCGVAIIAWSW